MLVSHLGSISKSLKSFRSGKNPFCFHISSSLRGPQHRGCRPLLPSQLELLWRPSPGEGRAATPAEPSQTHQQLQGSQRGVPGLWWPGHGWGWPLGVADATIPPFSRLRPRSRRGFGERPKPSGARPRRDPAVLITAAANCSVLWGGLSATSPARWDPSCPCQPVPNLPGTAGWSHGNLSAG